MHANPQRLQDEAPYPTLRLIEAPGDTSLASLIFRFLNLLRKAVWRAFQHDAFAIAKASAYSYILPHITCNRLGAGNSPEHASDVARNFGCVNQDHARRRGYCAGLLARKQWTIIWPDFHYLATYFVAGIRRYGFVDGRIPAVL